MTLRSVLDGHIPSQGRGWGTLPYHTLTLPRPNPNSLRVLACARLVAGEGDHVELRRPGLELAHPVGRGGQRHDNQVRLRQALRTAPGTAGQGLVRRDLGNPVASLCRLPSGGLRVILACSGSADQQPARLAVSMCFATQQ